MFSRQRRNLSSHNPRFVNVCTCWFLQNELELKAPCLMFHVLLCLGPMELNSKHKSTFKHSMFVTYPHDPGQAENQCLQDMHVFHISTAKHLTNTHKSPFPIMFEPFCLLSQSTPLTFSLSVSLLSVWVMFPL